MVIDGRGEFIEDASLSEWLHFCWEITIDRENSVSELYAWEVSSSL